MHNENNFNEKTNGLYSIFAFLSLLLFSCEEKLPKPTQDGKNTFGCKIDGKTWIPNGGTGFMPAKPINGGFWNGLSSNLPYYIYIETYNKSNQRIDLYINGYTEGTYILEESNGTKPNLLFPKNYGLYVKDGLNYLTSQKNAGKVIIEKADMNTGIISGTFEFIGTNNNETITITKGRFDINSKTLK